MINMLKISTSILSTKNRIKSIQELNETTTDYIHIDVMDNRFVRNYQFPINEVKKLAKFSNKVFDVHLMTEDPEKYINELNLNIVDSITIHVEIEKNINYLIKLIKSHGIEVGLAIKPNTNLNELNKYLNKIDKVLIMSVEPGFGGQKFLESTVERITKLRNKKADLLIEVDGGINAETIDKIKYISDIAVVGSFITNSDDYQEAINILKN